MNLEFVAHKDLVSILLHFLFDKSITSCLPQWNYENMRDDNVIVITTT